MAANAQSTGRLPKYGGSSTGNWCDFEALFRSIVDVTGIQANQRIEFLKLHLKDSALQFFHTLDENTQPNFKVTITALKNLFCNPNLKEIHQMILKHEIQPQIRVSWWFIGETSKYSDESLSNTSRSTSRTTWSSCFLLEIWKHRKASFIFKCQRSIRAQCSSSWPNWRQIQNYLA